MFEVSATLGKLPRFLVENIAVVDGPVDGQMDRKAICVLRDAG